MIEKFLSVNQPIVTKLHKKFSLSKNLKKLIDVLEKNGGIPILVGGVTRDFLLKKPCFDVDIEVFGLEPLKLEQVLNQNFSSILVGKSFGVYKVLVGDKGHQESFDVALPRLEEKTGSGHKAFKTTWDSSLCFKNAAKRRDFTINAMGIYPSKNLLLDPFSGAKDLHDKVLRHTGPAFVEDPLRVLRAAQFCARYNLKLSSSTKSLCKSLKEELKTLSSERIFWELKKLLLAKKPSIGLKVLKETQSLSLFPQLEALVECKQDKEWHPEGDVWVHTLMVVDEAAKLVTKEKLSQEDALIVLLGALCHDLGKPETSFVKNGRVKSPKHEQAGKDPTLSFLTKAGVPKKYHNEICELVCEHLKPFQLYKERKVLKDSAIKRLANRVDLEKLMLVAKADFLGRTTKEALSRKDPSYLWLKKKVAEIFGQDEKKVKPLIQGRDLVALGFTPSKKFGEVLNWCFERQLEESFDSHKEALKWLKNNLQKIKQKLL